ncbi:MAG: sulfotransferase family 2 domain-containing protein [bacterium]
MKNRITCINYSRYFIIDKFRFVYVEIPKVACTSFKFWMTQLLEMDFDISNWEKIHEVDFPMVKGIELKEKYIDYFKFSFVRNPWERILSCWLSKIKTPDYDDGKNWRKGVENNFWRYGDMFRSEMSFEDFINSVTQIPDHDADAHFRSQYTFIYDEDENPIVDFIGRFENIDSDFKKVCEIINCNNTVFPHLHNQKHDHYRKYYNYNTVKSVTKRYEEDIDIFKFTY